MAWDFWREPLALHRLAPLLPSARVVKSPLESTQVLATGWQRPLSCSSLALAWILLLVFAKDEGRVQPAGAPSGDPTGDGPDHGDCGRHRSHRDGIRRLHAEQQGRGKSIQYDCADQPTHKTDRGEQEALL